MVWNPIRETHIEMTIPPGMAGTTGNAVNMGAFNGPVAVLVYAGPGLAAPVTVTFEGTTEDPAAYCTPLAAGWSAINKGGFCEASEAMSITIDPAAAPYSIDLQQICRDFVQCHSMFLRAKLSGAAAQIAVSVVGAPKSVAQV